MPKALRAASDLVKGLNWAAILRKSRVRVFKGVLDIEAIGKDRLETLRYRTQDGSAMTVEANTLLVHEGVVPNLHAALSLDCEVRWNPNQDCFAPVVDSWSESSLPDVFIVGDGAGIAGAAAAQLRGQLAALRVAVKLGCTSEDAAVLASRAIRQKLDRALSLRPFLDTLFRPRTSVFLPADDTIVCRCEEVTAGEIRAFAGVGQPGPNQIKAATRVGMGPCQGRQCGYTVTRILCDLQKRPPSEVGFFHIRPPLKPVTLGELASLNQPDDPGG